MFGKKKMKCKYCTFSTTDRGAMAQHLRTYHASCIPQKYSNNVIGTYNEYDFIDDLVILEAASSFFGGGSSSSDDDSSSFSGGGGTFGGGGASADYSSSDSDSDD